MYGNYKKKQVKTQEDIKIKPFSNLSEDMKYLHPTAFINKYFTNIIPLPWPYKEQETQKKEKVTNIKCCNGENINEINSISLQNSQPSTSGDIPNSLKI